MSSISQQSTQLDPPRFFWSKFKFLGPGLILSASIVGSGELIATTLLGAKGGFIALWVILVSCLVKVAIQVEFGKKAILSGQSLMSELNTFSNNQSTKGHWTIWAIGVLTFFKIIQLGGMIGGAALALSLIFPILPNEASLVILGATLPLFFIKNYYSLIEKTASIMVLGFTLFTIISFIAVFYTPFAFSWEQVSSGFLFQLPKEILFVAIGAFGITGVASDEIIAYFYWCQEKGYARYAGTNDGAKEWRHRAEGWISVMKLDAIVAMVIYTLVTSIFYLLGASILYGKESLPEGTELILALASIYTSSLGEGAKVIYLIGGFFALYSSVFATLAYWTRLFPDILLSLKAIEFTQLNTVVRILAFVFPLAWIIMYWTVQMPGILVLIGGLIGSILLLVTLYIGIQFRKKNFKLGFGNSIISRLFFWISVSAILGISIYGIIQVWQ
jgi:manganese transport protein